MSGLPGYGLLSEFGLLFFLIVIVCAIFISLSVFITIYIWRNGNSIFGNIENGGFYVANNC